jgi:hypothetical protein
MQQNPPDIGLDAARHECKRAIGSQHLSVVLLTNHLHSLGWNWEAQTTDEALYVGIIGLPEPGDLPEHTIIAWANSHQYDLLPPLIRATAMALESKWARL